MREGTQSIGDGVAHQLVVAEFFMSEDLEEELGELRHGGNVLAEACVVNKVAHEAEGIEQFLSRELFVVLELGCPVGFRAGVDGCEGSVFELFDKLAGQLHDLTGHSTDLSHFILDLFKIFFVDLVCSLRLPDKRHVSCLKRSHEVKRVFHDRLQSVDLGVRHDVFLILGAPADGSDVVREGLNENLGCLFVVGLQCLL